MRDNRILTAKGRVPGGKWAYRFGGQLLAYLRLFHEILVKSTACVNVKWYS
jgi:hypothetical protein